jgi:hypothetical protein
MKKQLVISIVFILILSACSQQNKLPKIETLQERTPEWVSTLPPENEFWGIGIGSMNNLEASLENAIFNAHRDICRQLLFFIETVERSYQIEMGGELPPDIKEPLDILLEELVSCHVSFELRGLTNVKRRSKTADGSVWVLVSINKNNVSDILGRLIETKNEYTREYRQFILELSS